MAEEADALRPEAHEVLLQAGVGGHFGRPCCRAGRARLPAAVRPRWPAGSRRTRGRRGAGRRPGCRRRTSWSGRPGSPRGHRPSRRSPDRPTPAGGRPAPCRAPCWGRGRTAASRSSRPPRRWVRPAPGRRRISLVEAAEPQLSLVPAQPQQSLDLKLNLRLCRALGQVAPWELERMRVARLAEGAKRGPTLILRAGLSEARQSLRFDLRSRDCSGWAGTRDSCGSAASTRRCTTARSGRTRAARWPATPTRRCAARPEHGARQRPDGHLLRSGDPVIADLVGGHEGTWPTRRGRSPSAAWPATCAAPTTCASRSCGPPRPNCGREPARPALRTRSAEIAADAGLEEHFMGFGPQRIRFLGHGVGLEIDELPILAPASTSRSPRGT